MRRGPLAPVSPTNGVARRRPNRASAACGRCGPNRKRKKRLTSTPQRAHGCRAHGVGSCSRQRQRCKLYVPIIQIPPGGLRGGASPVVAVWCVCVLCWGACSRAENTDAFSFVLIQFLYLGPNRPSAVCTLYVHLASVGRTSREKDAIACIPLSWSRAVVEASQYANRAVVGSVRLGVLLGPSDHRVADRKVVAAGHGYHLGRHA